MKPAPFAYVDPIELDAALAVLAEHGDRVAVLSGGQSLIPLLNLRLARPDVVLDLRRIASLHSWALSDDRLECGGMVTAAALERSSALAGALPGLHQAIGAIGHCQIRERTTVGGSLAHADPAAELPAALLAFDGTVELASTRGRRTVAATDFFTGAFSTAREPDELVIGARFRRAAARSTTVEIARRPGDFAVAGAVVVSGDGVARIAVFGVHPHPLRIPAAEAALLGGASIADVADEVRRAVAPHADVHASARYRRHLAGTVVARAVERIAA